MERVDIGKDTRPAAVAEAATRGDEALTGGGAVVALEFDNREAAGPIDLQSLREIRRRLAPYQFSDVAALIRDMRDESDH